MNNTISKNINTITTKKRTILHDDSIISNKSSHYESRNERDSNDSLIMKINPNINYSKINNYKQSLNQQQVNLGYSSSSINKRTIHVNREEYKGSQNYRQNYSTINPDHNLSIVNNSHLREQNKSFYKGSQMSSYAEKQPLRRAETSKHKNETIHSPIKLILPEVNKEEAKKRKEMYFSDVKTTCGLVSSNDHHSKEVKKIRKNKRYVNDNRNDEPFLNYEFSD
jgi:hypothetical protein